jgi:esterase/lipase
MKTVLFVPGFQEGLADRDYESIIKLIEKKGYEVEFVDIHWTRTTIDDWVTELETIYQKYNPKNIVLAGFSFGAYIAFVGASKQNPSALWLFSLSPYFYQDIPKLKKSWLTHIGHRRVDSFKKLDFDKLTQQINCETLIISGDIENKKYPIMYDRAIGANKSIKNSKYIEAVDSDHDISSKGYIEAIQNNI